MDARAPSPFPQAPTRGGYPAGYAAGYPTGFPEAAPAEMMGMPGHALNDPEVLAAKRTHARGTSIYLLAWVILAASVPLLAIALGLLISSALSNSSSGLAQNLLLASLGLMGGGMALRGVGFSLMMKADFVIRTHAWLGAR